ncbi:hypothetical protein D3C75_1368170 [compost metagenome]
MHDRHVQIHECDMHGVVQRKFKRLFPILSLRCNLQPERLPVYAAPDPVTDNIFVISD